MQLYKVEYKEWNMTFSGLYTKTMLSVGNNEKEAIEKVKKSTGIGAGNFYDFKAEKVENVFGCNIVVQEKETCSENIISWSLNEENNELEIFLGEAILATISDVFPPEDENDYLTGLVNDTLYGMGYKWNTDGTISKMEVNK